MIPNMVSNEIGHISTPMGYLYHYLSNLMPVLSNIRDTNHRVEPVGSCTNLQAGYEDGTYLRTIHSVLNN